MSARTLPLKSAGAGSILGQYPRARTSQVSDARTLLVKLVTVAVFAVCMSAPEYVLASPDPDALNPFVGPMKLLLLGLACVLVFLCRSSRYIKPIARPFVWFIVWTLICWIVSGANALPFRNLVSSFEGIVVLAGLCGAAEFVDGVRGMVGLLIWALVITTVVSVLLGVLGVEVMPGEIATLGQLEWFHGIGTPAYMVAACACLIAWVLARQLADPGFRSVGPILLLLVIPALSFLRTYLIGIVFTIIAAALLALRRQGKGRSKALRGGTKRLLLLVSLSLIAGAVIFFMKTSSREEGNELSGRQIIWPIEIASVIQHPIVGLGPFGDIQLLYFDEQLPQVGAAHSDYLGAAVCYGLPGLFLFVGALMGLWKRVVRFPTLTTEERICRDAALLSLVGLATTIVAENVIRDPRTFSLHLLFPALCLTAVASVHQRTVR